MRQKLFCLLAVLALLPAAGYGQFASVVVTDANMSQYCSVPISRSWTPTQIVSYCTDTSRYFYLYDLTGGYYKYEALLDVYIADFKICNGIVYFCGSGDDGSGNIVGKIGWFDANDFFSGTINYQVSDIPEASFLYKLLAYDDPNNGWTKVIAFGYSFIGGDYCLMEFVDLVGNVITTTTYDYITLPPRQIVDMMETAQYVVIAETRWTGAGLDIALRRADKYNVIASMMLDDVYEYPSGTGMPEVGSYPVATALDNDRVAVAYMYEDVLSGGGIYTRIRIVDMASLNMDNSIDIIEQDKTAPVAMTYIPNNGMLAVLNEEDLTMNSARCTYVDPWTMGYTTTDYVYVAGEIFSSMDIHDGQYLMMGGSQPLWWLIDATATLPLNPPFVSFGSCPDNGYIDVDLTPVLNVNFSYDAWFLPMSGNLNPQPDSSSSNPMSGMLCIIF